MAQYVIATSAGFTVASGNFTHSVGDSFLGATTVTTLSTSGTLDASGLATFASVTITQELQYLKFSGTAQFASGGTQLAVVLGTTLPDANYAVMVSPHFNSYSTTSLYVSGRSVNSFMANVDNATGVTGTARTISYMVLYGSATANP